MTKGPDRELRGAYQREAQKLLDQMRGSLSALEKGADQKTRDDREKGELYCLFRCAHTLKSSSADVGNHNVAAVAKRLEEYFRSHKDGAGRIDQSTIPSLHKIVIQCRRLLKNRGAKVDTRLLAPVIRSGGKIEPATVSPTTPLKVLLIEDSAYFESKVRKLLGGDKDFDVTLHSSGTLFGGIQLLEKIAVDLVLLDLTLPDSDGLKTLEKVLAKNAKLPVVIFTATDDKTLGLKAISAGALDYLVKKEVAGRLLSRSIRYALERHRLFQELEQAHKKEREQLQKEVVVLKELSGSQEKPGARPLPKPDRATLRNVALGYEEMLSAHLNDRENEVDAIQRNFCDMLLASLVPTKLIVECHLLAVKKVVDNVDRVLAQRTLQTSRMLLLKVMTRYASLLREKYGG